jgi:ribosome biogenesis GTPase
MDERRLRNYLKLQREAANAARTVHERRERDRQFGRMHKAVQERHRKDKQGR